MSECQAIVKEVEGEASQLVLMELWMKRRVPRGCVGNCKGSYWVGCGGRRIEAEGRGAECEAREQLGKKEAELEEVERSAGVMVESLRSELKRAKKLWALNCRRATEQEDKDLKIQELIV